MFKSLFFTIALLFGAQSYAMPAPQIESEALAEFLKNPISSFSLDWKVGDTAEYNVKGGIINGSLRSFVREETAEGIWVQQDADLGFAGKQKVEILFDKNSGAVLQVIVNGEKKALPNPAENEVIESRRASVTVPKGTFDCLYAKIRNTKSNDVSEVWLNAELVPVGGLVKTIVPSQIGAITVELKNYKKI